MVEFATTIMRLWCAPDDSENAFCCNRVVFLLLPAMIFVTFICEDDATQATVTFFCCNRTIFLLLSTTQFATSKS